MKPYVLMVGPHPQRVIGGVSAMIALIQSSRLTEQFQIEHIPTMASGSKGRKLWTVLGALMHFFVRLVTRRVSLVYIHIGGDVSLYRKSAFILLAKVLRRKVLLHYHAGHFDSYYTSRSRLGRWFLGLVLRLSDRILTVSTRWSEAIRRHLPNHNIQVLHNAVNQAELTSGNVTSTSETLRVLFMGNLTPLKGIYDLLEAIPHITARQPNIRFLLCGTDDVERVRALCHEQGITPFVEHIGPVPMNQRRALWQQADIFVLPSYEEGFPVSILEAMALGLPVVSTPVGGIPEVIDDGVNGFLLPPGDAEALAARVLTLAKNRDLRRRMGHVNRTKISQQFDITPYAEKLAHHWRLVMENRSSQPGTAEEVLPPLPVRLR